MKSASVLFWLQDLHLCRSNILNGKSIRNISQKPFEAAACLNDINNYVRNAKKTQHFTVTKIK
jgi:hypothetical protein